METAVETIRIEGFLHFKEANIDIRPFTIFLGPQASGKSVAAKLHFVFREYVSQMFSRGIQKQEHKATFDAEYIDRFARIFPTYSYESQAFKISYQFRDIEIVFEKTANASKPSIKTSKNIASAYREVKRSFKDFEASILADERLARSVQFNLLRFFDENNHKMFSDFEIPETLFVPAARSFYATFRREVFSLLSINKDVDPFLIEFGRFYERAKRIRELRKSRKQDEAKSILYRELIGGTLEIVDDVDFIVYDKRKVEVSRASSGQQEALPLLMALEAFLRSANENQCLTIEEPEAHLFPTAQKRIIEEIVSVFDHRLTRILFTTHSPYIVACANNFLLKEQGDLFDKENEIIAAYFIDGSTVRDIIDRDTKIISVNEIDSVSQEIAEEFDNALFG